jgi:hypothetical protein
MPEAYYNTNNETGTTLKKSEGKALTQEDIILAYFEKHPNSRFPAHAVLAACFFDATPLTSIRRAITNLEIKGKLELMPDEYMVPGLFGKQVHVWKFKQQKGQLKLL